MTKKSEHKQWVIVQSSPPFRMDDDAAYFKGSDFNGPLSEQQSDGITATVDEDELDAFEAERRLSDQSDAVRLFVPTPR